MMSSVMTLTNLLAHPRHLAERWVMPMRSRGNRPPPRDRAARAPRRADGGAGEPVTPRDGRTLTLRAIRADDVDALQRFFRRLTPEEVRLRFLHPLNELSDAFAHQLCELNPKLAFAWVLATPD